MHSNVLVVRLNFNPTHTKTLSDANVQDLIMAQKKMLLALGPFVIGLLLVELGLFCYSFYDPTIRSYPEFFPLRGWATLLLLLGVAGLSVGTIYLLLVNGEEKESC